MSYTWWPDDREVDWRRVWSAPCIRRQGVWVSWFGLKTKVDGFPCLVIKTGSCCLVIWASKSLWLFFGLDLKTKWAIICRLCYKTDGMRTAWDTHRDLMAYFARKQVKLVFSSLPQNWRRCDNGWCMWHHRRDRMEIKLNTGESMRRATSDSSIPRSSFICTRL
jgi:hypothetical protein